MLGQIGRRQFGALVLFISGRVLSQNGRVVRFRSVQTGKAHVVSRQGFCGPAGGQAVPANETGLTGAVRPQVDAIAEAQTAKIFIETVALVAIQFETAGRLFATEGNAAVTTVDRGGTGAVLTGERGRSKAIFTRDGIAARRWSWCGYRSRCGGT